MGGTERRPRLTALPSFAAANGRLVAIEGLKDVPFAIRRVFFFDRVPRRAERGGHAHRRQRQFVVCLAGSFEARLDDGRRRRTVLLDDPRRGLFLPPMVWSSLAKFRPGSVGLVLSSAAFSERDYIRDRRAFRAAARRA